MKDLGKMQVLALELVNVCDSIIKKKLKNSIAIGFWNKIGKPFITNQIVSMEDKDIQQDLNDFYNKLKPHFEKKVLKEMIDEANSLSGIKLSKLKNPKFEEAGEYF